MRLRTFHARKDLNLYLTHDIDAFIITIVEFSNRVYKNSTGIYIDLRETLLFNHWINDNNIGRAGLVVC